MYLIRLSQCKIQQSFQVVYSWDNLYHIKCTHPPYQFSHAIKFLTSIGRDPKKYCSGIHTVEYLRQMYAEGDDPVCAIVINDLCINPLAPPTVKTLRCRKKKNRIKSQSITAPKVWKTRTVICPLCSTQGHTRRTCRRRNVGPSLG